VRGWRSGSYDPFCGCNSYAGSYGFPLIPGDCKKRSVTAWMEGDCRQHTAWMEGDFRHHLMGYTRRGEEEGLLRNCTRTSVSTEQVRQAPPPSCQRYRQTHQPSSLAQDNGSRRGSRSNRNETSTWGNSGGCKRHLSVMMFELTAWT
jgi:hypothetical protein